MRSRVCGSTGWVVLVGWIGIFCQVPANPMAAETRPPYPDSREYAWELPSVPGAMECEWRSVAAEPVRRAMTLAAERAREKINIADDERLVAVTTFRMTLIRWWTKSDVVVFTVVSDPDSPRFSDSRRYRRVGVASYSGTILIDALLIPAFDGWDEGQGGAGAVPMVIPGADGDNPFLLTSMSTTAYWLHGQRLRLYRVLVNPLRAELAWECLSGDVTKYGCFDAVHPVFGRPPYSAPGGIDVFHLQSARGDSRGRGCIGTETARSRFKWDWLRATFH